MSAMLEDAHDLVMDAEEEEEKGNIVLKSGKKQRYEIVKPIVTGNNSTVYLVNHLLKDGSFVKMAMKAENQGIKSESTGFALANEIRFLVEYQKRWRDQVHGCEHLLPICDYGHSKRYKFLIMPLLGPNLDQLREEMKKEFSFFTILDLFGRNELPWNKFKNMSKETIEERKLLMFNSVVAGPGNLHSRGSGLNVFPMEVRTICAIMNRQNYKVSDLRLQLIKLLNRANVGINIPFEWEETPEYLACKDMKFDMKQYKLNVEAIRECTKKLLKNYNPPPKDDSESQN